MPNFTIAQDDVALTRLAICEVERLAISGVDGFSRRSLYGHVLERCVITKL
jgi:hypothetical protein